MKPLAKKGLMVILVLYLVTVALMVANFLREQRPEHPEEVARRVREEINLVQQWAYEGDPEHIRERPVSDAEAVQIFEQFLVRKGTIININYTLIMQCLNFGILLLVLYGWLWEPMLAALDKRRARIRQQLDAAAGSIDEAEKLRKRRNEELSELRRERADIIEQAKTLGEQEREEIVERARREAERLMQQTQERLAEEARRARMALREEIAEIAVSVATEALKRQITPEDHDRLISDVTEAMAFEPAPGSAEGEGTA
jgi:F-type H+-transporting ATPase subunit b